MMERAPLLFYLFKLVNSAKDTEFSRAPAASLVATLGVGALGSQ